MNKRDSKLMDIVIDEIFGVSKIQTNGYIGLRCKWSKCFTTEAIAPVGTDGRYKYIVTVWATPSGWVYGAVGTHDGYTVIPICPEAELNRALWAGNTQYLPALSKLANMVD